MNLILALGTSLSAAALAVGFAVVSDRVLSSDRIAEPQQPAPILPARVAPDLSVGQLQIPARDVAAANPADMNAAPSTFQAQPDLPSAMTSITDAQAWDLMQPPAYPATSRNTGPALKLAPPAATAFAPAPLQPSAPAEIAAMTSDYKNRENAQSSRMTLLDPALRPSGDPLAASLATTGIAPRSAAASDADPGSIPAWRFQTLPLIGVYR
ncbi:MAG: hypothetical protein ACK5LJ_13545 [Paracoccus sp. (in: a-proteobacteria)]